MEGRQQGHYSREFKVEVQLITEGQPPVSEATRELGVKPERLREWRRQLAPELAPAPRSEAEELARLRRENAMARQEREFLGKAAAY